MNTLIDITKTFYGWRVSRSLANVPQQNPPTFLTLREALDHARAGGLTDLRVWYKARVVGYRKGWGAK